MNAPTIILASSSVYRQTLLKRLHIPFQCISPDIDESSHENEAAADLVRRLSQQKAEVVAETYPDAIIIASDQVAEVNGLTLTKPGNHQNAIKQLQQLSGQTVTFHTGLCVIQASQSVCCLESVPFRVTMRSLSHEQIERYVIKEKPFDCAGSFKSEAYGISLFSKMEGDDPNALIGLPLIRLTHILNDLGLEIP